MNTEPDPYKLERFVLAQAPVFGQVLSELESGAKKGHWMWFVFPQIQGLGHSPVSRKYAISGLDEARAYLRHPTLGPRIKHCTQLLLNLQGRTVHDIFGSPDNLKFRSSMTLFAEASAHDDIFARALEKYFDGQRDRITLERL